MSTVIALTAIGCAQPKQHQNPGKPGASSFQAMPAFDLQDLSGKTWNAKSFKGKTVLLEFWATWCGPCREIAPEIQAFSRRTKETIAILSVSLDKDRKALERYIQKHPFQNPVLHGGESMAKPWNVDQIPALILIRDGHIVFKWEGKEAVLQGLLAVENEGV